MSSASPSHCHITYACTVCHKHNAYMIGSKRHIWACLPVASSLILSNRGGTLKTSLLSLGRTNTASQWEDQGGVTWPRKRDQVTKMQIMKILSLRVYDVCVGKPSQWRGLCSRTGAAGADLHANVRGNGQGTNWVLTLTLLMNRIQPRPGEVVEYKYFVTVLKYIFLVSVLIFLTTFYFDLLHVVH